MAEDAHVITSVLLLGWGSLSNTPNPVVGFRGGKKERKEIREKEMKERRRRRRGVIYE